MSKKLKKKVEKGITLGDIQWIDDISYYVELAILRAKAIHEHYAKEGIVISLDKIFQEVCAAARLHINHYLNQQQQPQLYAIPIPKKKKRKLPYIG